MTILRLFLDTNVLLDVLMRREPFYGSSARVWTLAETGTHHGFVSAVSFIDVYHLLRKHGGDDRAHQSLHLIRSVFRPVEVDTRLLDEALAVSGGDFEDGDFEDTVQLRSALRCGADYLVTRDRDGFQSAPVSIVTADELLAVLAVDRA